MVVVFAVGVAVGVVGLIGMVYALAEMQRRGWMK